MSIHPTAIVDSGAHLGENVEVGPYAIIESDVHIGSGCKIGPHSMIHEYVKMGSDCVIYPYASVGAAPQDLKFHGEKSWLTIGKKTVIREFATLNRGTEAGGGITEVGEENFLMAYTHIAHDCKTGRGVIMSNNATLAGHVITGDYATLGGFVAIHQFVHLGSYAYIGGKSAVVKDIPPYVRAAGDRAVLHGLNKVGLQRHGFDENTLLNLKRAYRIMFRLDFTVKQAVERIKAEVEMIPEVAEFVSFIENSDRGITR